MRDLTERLYDMTLDGMHNRETGNVTENGVWYGGLENLKLGGELINARYAIVSQDEQGFKNCETFSTFAEYDTAWNAIESDIAEFYANCE